MAGQAALLLENGNLRSASWCEDPIGSYWVISGIRGIDVSGMTMLDQADVGKWKKARPTAREQYCEKFERCYEPEYPPSVGFRSALKRLFDGAGIRMFGTPTGMSARPRGPEWSLDKPE